MIIKGSETWSGLSKTSVRRHAYQNVEISQEKLDELQELKNKVGYLEKCEAFARKYKEVKFFELKRLNKQREKLLKSAEQTPEIEAQLEAIDKNILYVKVCLIELSSWRTVYLNSERANRRGHQAKKRSSFPKIDALSKMSRLK